MSKTYHPSLDVTGMPARIHRLPVDERLAMPVPWFVAWHDGKPDFRDANTAKRAEAIKRKLCWVCGEPLGRFMSFLVGPMCCINRTSAEPPMHNDCATWSAKNCPFLSNPNAKRREDETHTEATLQSETPGGIALARNPGVTAVWTTRSYAMFRAAVGKDGFLINIGHPENVAWYCRGRDATRLEVMDSINSGLPVLLEMANLQDRENGKQIAVQELRLRCNQLMNVIPPNRSVAPFTAG